MLRRQYRTSPSWKCLVAYGKPSYASPSPSPSTHRFLRRRLLLLLLFFLFLFVFLPSSLSSSIFSIVLILTVLPCYSFHSHRVELANGGLTPQRKSLTALLDLLQGENGVLKAIGPMFVPREATELWEAGGVSSGASSGQPLTAHECPFSREQFDTWRELLDHLDSEYTALRLRGKSNHALRTDPVTPAAWLQCCFAPPLGILTPVKRVKWLCLLTHTHTYARARTRATHANAPAYGEQATPRT